jgi:Tol biopolymer transport system component
VNNGSYDHSVGLNWEFDWSDVPGSTSYELYVMHIGATIPFLDIKTNESKYTTANNNDINTGYIADVNRKGWTWKVRALVNVQWSDWSETSIFDVAPLIATTSTTTISTTQITTTPVTQNLPNTGSKIAFVSDRDGKWAIYAMNADGSNQVRLTDTNFDSFRPVWSPDSTKIAFSSGRNGPSEIYVMSADGGNQRKLTNNIYCDNPAWSTDGTKIAYRCDSNGPGGVYVMNADGTNQTSLNVFTYDHVVWSPDSQKIAFSPVIDSTIPSEIAKNGIYIMKADGSNIT